MLHDLGVLLIAPSVLAGIAWAAAWGYARYRKFIR